MMDEKTKTKIKMVDKTKKDNQKAKILTFQ